MTKQNGDFFDPNYLRQGSPTNVTTVESFPRTASNADLAIAATGVELAVGIPVQAGDVVSTITFITGATAAGTPTAGYAVLRDPTGAKLVQSADFGSTARAANTVYNIALTTPYTVQAAGFYYVGISFTATTVPTLRGITFSGTVMAGNVVGSLKVLSQTHGSAVGGTAPATIATPTTASSVPYIVLT